MLPGLLASALLILLAGPALAQAERVVEIPSRGQPVRALLIQPPQPAGSVILLAGGHGNIDLSPDGAIGWGRDNHLVRTRALYAAAGYVTLVPDIAPDLKQGREVVPRYRVGAPNAADIGAAVVYLRALKPPVVVIGTSRGSISAANAAARLTGASRPDGLVVSSAFLDRSAGLFSVPGAAGSPSRLNLPVLVIEHRHDTCKVTGPEAVEPFLAWMASGGGKAEIAWMDGGTAPRGDPCESRAAHGFPGLDGEVVAATVSWIRTKVGVR